jgi:hypothetical protein
VSCSYISDVGGYRACNEICGVPIATVALSEHTSSSLSFGSTDNHEFALLVTAIYSVGPKATATWIDAMSAGHFSRGWL